MDSATDFITVKTKRLDDVLEDVSNVSLLRMDAEGSEPLIIRGARGVIERSPDLRIVMEWSVNMMSGAANTSDFIADLEQMGFRAWRIDGEAVFTPLQMSELENLPTASWHSHAPK